MATATPLTSAQLSDTRRFAGYPTEAALPYQSLQVQGDSAALDAVLAALTGDQINTLVSVYLTSLYTIEAGISGASDGLDVDKAAVYTRNANELADREFLFQSWRLKLCYFLGVPAGAGVYASSGSASLAPAAFVV